MKEESAGYTKKSVRNYDMPQVTIYLEEDVMTSVKSASETGGVSQSKWIADAIRARFRLEWPGNIKVLGGCWKEFPTLEEIRMQQAEDLPREKF